VTTLTAHEQEILNDAKEMLRGVELERNWVPTPEEADLLLMALAIRSEHTVHEGDV
jgi:hypothetical protein